MEYRKCKRKGRLGAGRERPLGLRLEKQTKGQPLRGCSDLTSGSGIPTHLKLTFLGLPGTEAAGGHS